MSEIIKAICEVMKEVEPIAKTRQAKGYRYRGIDDAYSHLQLLMAKHGLVTAPMVLDERTEDRTTSSGNAIIYRILKIMYTFYHTSGEKFDVVVIGEAFDSGDKATNKALSVAHKYALMQVFCIPTDEPKDPEVDTYQLAPKYLGSPQQKRELVALFVKHGVNDAEKMKSIAALCNGALMSDLEKIILSQLKKPEVAANESSNTQG